MGPAQRALCESRQDRKVAAATEQSFVRRLALPELTAEITQGKDGRSRVHGLTPAIDGLPLFSSERLLHKDTLSHTHRSSGKRQRSAMV